jgi:hypothetical protein
LQEEQRQAPFDLASAADGLLVLDASDGKAYLGRLAFEAGGVVIHSGFVGRPHAIAEAGVVCIRSAAEHSDVYIPRQSRRH